MRWGLELDSRLVAKLGLLFGCIDLILGTDGNCYFLEVNEMGQFLWIERLCPEERYLEAFVQFLFGLCQVGSIPSGIELADVLDSTEYQNILQGILTLPAAGPDPRTPTSPVHSGAAWAFSDGSGFDMIA